MAMDTVIDGEAIRRRRRERGLTGRELARVSGVDQAVISRIERGLQADLLVGALVALARALDAPLDALVTGATPGQMVSLVAEFRAEVDAVAALPDAQQRHAADLLHVHRAALADAAGHSDGGNAPA